MKLLVESVCESVIINPSFLGNLDDPTHFLALRFSAPECVGQVDSKSILGHAMIDHPTREEYLRDFPLSSDIRKEALKQALDIRKFEIELYWKRATYFWAFIAASFAGYFALQANAEPANTYTITCLGFLFSLAWYLVNRGSGAWQRHWESHVDLLEDEVMGPLYKTLLNRDTHRFYHLAEPYAYSPSRINTLLALGVTITWMVLIARTLSRANAFRSPYSGTITAMSILTVVGAIALFWGAHSRKAKEIISVERSVRKYR
jgi:hypothetical protein